jgi:hypothetical protein
MRIQHVDPRDIEWEIESPVYRVHFWEHPDAPASGDDLAPSRSDEYEISGAPTVRDVLKWAKMAARGRSCTIYVLVDHAGTRGLVQVWASGSNNLER